MKLRQTIIGLAALLGAASAHALVDPGSHYDNANDFSLAQNPNGAWSYGYSLTEGGAFNAFTNAMTAGGLQTWYTPSLYDLGTPAVYRNPTLDPVTAASATVAGLEAGFHPGPTSLAIYRFTAPTAATYSVEALFYTQDTNATGVNVHVLKDGGTQLFTAPVTLAQPTRFWTGNVTLAAGGTLDFAVDNGGFFHYDSTGLGVQIAAVPEPETYALFGAGLGAIGLALRRRKAKYDRAAIR